MIELKPIEEHQIIDAKKVILSVARNIYQWDAPLDQILEQFDQRGELSDIDNFQSSYLTDRGLFLVVLDRGQVIGTGAVRRLTENICELKRLWLLTKYQGKGIGYRVLQELIRFARSNGYTKIRLETDLEQVRAIEFYRQVGFQPIAKYNNRNSDVYMEMTI